MFLTERELKEVYWKNYNYSNRALRYQFECPLREGAADLVTIERFQNEYQINSFEFKLNDIKKGLLQAKANIPYVNKSWIVVPSEKEKTVLEKYGSYIKEAKYIGVITVDEGGKWNVIIKPHFQKEIKINQAILKVLMNEM